MTKILKPYTIIPPELYVKRDADRQLLNIIEDMGRPGYVLVSRQMGKTNLLLNAKREAETPDDIFVYIDLSNPFASAKDCFENIVDTIVEVYEDNLNEVSTIIKQMRKDAIDAPAHKQHVAELRKIINSIKGKLVVILDEIDALTKTNYSDRIFSQIRSIYFTRTNFPELSRLTYVLSGVVEPTEIIKDPKISPFNIGQKIFLNDFTFAEFTEFVKMANLKISDEILKYIYKWASGNPRITWDICSEIETICNNKEITLEDIDKIIKETYLISYDKPPVDNIRELIKNDAELRNAIVEIEHNKGEVISDRIKSKLYLAGIINYTNGNVRLKNDVIRKAVNLEWINSINEEEKGLIKIALEHFNKYEFQLCLNAFKKYLKNNSFSPDENSLYYYYMGYSAYKVPDYEEALKYLDNTDFDIEDDTKFYYLTLNLKGILNYYQGNIEPSLKYFKSVLSRSKKDEIYARALVNFGSISLQSNNSIHINEAKEIFHEIINEKGIDSSKLGKEFLNELKSISYYNLAQIELNNNQSENAIQYYGNAIEISPIENKPKIILGLIPEIKDEKEQEKLLQVIVSLVVDKRVKPREFDPDKPMSFDIEQFNELLLLLYSLEDKSLFSKMKSQFNLINNKSLGKNLYDLALFSVNKNKDLDISISILKDIYINKENAEYDIDKETFYDSLKLISYFSNSKTEFNKLKEYVELFQYERFGDVDFIDIENFANYIYISLERKDIAGSLKAIEIINSVKKTVNEKYLINYLVIHNLELNVYLTLSDIKKSKETAEAILTMTNDEKIRNQKSTMLGDSGFDIIKTNAESILKPSNSPSSPVRVEKKIGRNEIIKVKYKNGEIKKVKYKNVKEDIELGNCSIVK